MKIKNFLPLVVIISTSILGWGCSSTRNLKADPPLDSTAIRRMIDSPSFVFVARYVNPWNGRRRDLTSGYDILVSKDTIISYLPFFGRGYTAPISPSDVDFDFTSTKFSYNVKPARRGWEISIKPRDKMGVQELFFRIFDNGTGTINVTSIDRSAISYDGYITRRKTNTARKK